MAVLARDEILKKIKSGGIVIEPFNKKCLGPASYDLHLGNKFRVFKGAKAVFLVNEAAKYEKITKLVETKEPFLLMPGQMIHATTLERIGLAENIAARLEGRSRFGRLGLMVHITAGFIQPGTEGYQVLEMNNSGPMPLLLEPNLAVCQIIFEEIKGKARYSGRFKGQVSP
jgi:dCTP deaminase